VVIDHAKAEIGLGVCRRPNPIVGRRAAHEAAHPAFGLDRLGVDRGVPEAHRFATGETFVHRGRVIGSELAQPQAGSCENRVRYEALRHFEFTLDISAGNA
jgi:hypothetical protein